MAGPIIAGTEGESLEDMVAREAEEIAALEKEHQIPGDDILADTSVEETPAAEETAKEVIEGEPEKKVETPEPEPEPQPEPAKEPVKEPTPEPEKPPLEVKPPEKEKVPVWKALRESEKKLKALEEENARLKAAQEKARAEADPDSIQQLEEEDPLTKIQKKQEQLDATLAQQAAEQRQRDVDDAIRRDEAAFAPSHPDYQESLEFIAKRARQRFELTGELGEQTEVVLKQQQDTIDRVLAFRKIAEPTDAEYAQAAEDIAFATIFQNERVKFIARNRAKGKSIAEAAYELAQSEGWAGPAAEATPEPTPAPVVDPAKLSDKRPTTAQERVQRQAKIAQTFSLSTMQNGGAAQKIEVKSKADFMQMRAEDQDAFMEHMENIDPDWLQKLPEV